MHICFCLRASRAEIGVASMLQERHKGKAARSDDDLRRCKWEGSNPETSHTFFRSNSVLQLTPTSKLIPSCRASHPLHACRLSLFPASKSRVFPLAVRAGIAHSLGLSSHAKGDFTHH